MDSGRAERHLRLAAEAILRRALTLPRDSGEVRPQEIVTTCAGRLDRIATTLIAAGAIGADRAEVVVDEFQAALDVRYLGSRAAGQLFTWSPRPPGPAAGPTRPPAPGAAPGTAPRGIPASPVPDAGPGTGTGTGPPAGPERVIPVGRMLPLLAHPDAEGELVLAALGGEKAACVELAGAWYRHADDLGVLAAGPRGPTDKVHISWDDVQEFRSAGHGMSGTRLGRVVPHSQPMRRSGPGPAGAGRPRPAPRSPRRPIPPHWTDELEQAWAARLDMLSLLALGPAFQMVLSGVVAAAWSDGGPRARDRHAHRPALTGRLAPAVAGWLGIDPDQVDAYLHEGPGWGSLELTGTGRARHLRAALPAAWLAVWACGLTVADGHLVVAVEHAAWPDATVLAVPEPGRDPVILSVRARESAGTAGDRAHWEVTGHPPATPGGPDEPARPSRGEAD